MTAEEILAEWTADAPISEIDLGGASRNIQNLHAKYSNYLLEAKSEIAKARYLYKRMRGLKYEFFLNPNLEDSEEYGWEMPERPIMRTEIKDLLDTDKDLLKLDMTIQEADAKLGLVDSILRQILNRNWLVKNAIEDRAFLHGE